MVNILKSELELLSLSTDEFRTKTEKMARYIFYASKEIEFGSWMILKLKNSNFKFPSYPDFVQGLVNDGGLIPHVKKSLGLS